MAEEKLTLYFTSFDQIVYSLIGIEKQYNTKFQLMIN